MQKRWIQYVKEGQYVKLSDYLSLCVKKGVKLEAFFNKEGHHLLNQAINGKDLKSLEFLDQNMPQQCIQSIFANRDHRDYILIGFLNTQSGLEQLGWMNSDRLTAREEKIKFLIKWNVHDLLKNSMHSRKDLISQSVIDSIDQILEKYNPTNQQPTNMSLSLD